MFGANLFKGKGIRGKKVEDVTNRAARGVVPGEEKYAYVSGRDKAEVFVETLRECFRCIGHICL